MIIKLVRHGQSELQTGEVNATQVGDHNVAITSLGVENSRVVGKVIGANFISNALVYVSPYAITRHTLYEMIGLDGADVAQHIGSVKKLKIYEDVRLREMEWGFNKSSEDLQKEEFYYRLHGGESPADVYDRVSTFIDSLHRQIERKRKSKVLIVTHGITIRCFVMRWLYLKPEQFVMIENPHNCDVITIANKHYIQHPQFSNGKWGVTGLRLREPISL